MRRIKIAALTLLLLSLIQSPALTEPTTMSKRAVPNQVIVVPKQGLESDELNESLSKVNGTIINTTTNGGLTCYLVQITAGNFEQSLKDLKKDSNFSIVQRNLLGRKKRHDRPFTGTPNDPLLPMQYQLAQLNIFEAWKQGATGRIKIGIIDDGVRGDQIDLFPRVSRGYNAVTDRPGGDRPNPDTDDHGTPVATFAAATTNNRILGAAPAYNAEIVPVDVFNHVVSNVDDFTLIKGLQWLESQQVRLTNMSLNQDAPDYYTNQQEHPALFAEFRSYHRSGGLLFMAAGNESTYDPNPRTRALIVIAGTNKQDGSYSGTNFGKSVWFAAPGQAAVASDIRNQPETTDGTSFSSPLACSVAALVWSANPRLTNNQVLDIMQKTARKPAGYKPDYFGYGIPNAGAAVKMALGN